MHFYSGGKLTVRHSVSDTADGFNLLAGFPQFFTETENLDINRPGCNNILISPHSIDEVDEYTRQMYGKATEILAKNPEHIQFVLQAVTAGRHLERIADHATNIAEDVVYLVDAEIVRHTPEEYGKE